MHQHKFQVGQFVSIARSLQSTASGQYEIVRLIPIESGDPTYLVKGKHEPYSRVVAEHQLAPVNSAPGAVLPAQRLEAKQ